MFGKPSEQQAIAALAQQLVRLSESVDARFKKSSDLFQDIIKSREDDKASLIKVLGDEIFDVKSRADQRLEVLARILDDMSAQKSELLGEMIKEAKRRDAEFIRIDDAIAAMEERLDRLETALEQPLEALTDRPFSWRTVKGAKVLTVKGKEPLKIAYLSDSGASRNRVVYPHKAAAIELTEAISIIEFSAYCTLRMRIMVFKIEKIAEAWDGKTGEKVDATEWLLAHMVE